MCEARTRREARFEALDARGREAAERGSCGLRHDFRDVGQRQDHLFEALHEKEPRLLQRGVVNHDEDVREKRVDGGTELRGFRKPAAEIAGGDGPLNHLLALFELLQQRELRRLVEDREVGRFPRRQLAGDVAHALERGRRAA